MKTLTAMLLLALWMHEARAQFSVKTDFNMMHDDNIDNNYLQITDRIASASLDLEYSWSSEKYETDFSYTGMMNYYSSIIERSYLSHRISYQYIRALGEKDATVLDLNAGFSARVGRGNFKIYDHQIYFGTVGLQHDFSDITASEGNYSLQVIRFKNLPDFSYTEHNLSGQFSTSFKSKTSVILRSDFGIKLYASQTYTDTSTTSTGGMGYGQHQSGQTTGTSTQTSSPTVTQLVCMVRIGQSIFERTGISFTGQYQWNFRKESRYLSSNYGSIPDDVIFDDHYGYEGLLLSAMLTQILPFDSRARLTISRQKRLYSTLPALDLSGILISDKRNDTRTIFSAQLKKDFTSWDWSLIATYDYIINSSNDPFYDYRNNAITVGLSLPFNP